MTKRRAHGIGGIDPRGENTWRLRYRVGGKREEDRRGQATRDDRGSPPIARPQPRVRPAIQPTQVQRHDHRKRGDGNVSDGEVTGAHGAEIAERHRANDKE